MIVTLLSTVCFSLPILPDVDDLIAAIVGAIAEFLFEVFLELIAAAILDFASRALRGLFTAVAEGLGNKRVLTGFAYTFFGALAGRFSLFVLPHPLIHRQQSIGFHGISLLLSPLIAGFVLSSVGAVLRRWGKKVTPVETFGYGFCFALGMALIRFFSAK